MAEWVLNFGEGSFRTGDYGAGETKELHFAYTRGEHHSTQFEGWHAEVEEESFDVAYNDAEHAGVIHELEDDGEHTLNGIIEYGIGFWSRFLWNGLKAKLLNKPEWMGLARVASRKDFQDAALPGDRNLAVFVGRGFYHFATYSNSEPNIFQNIPYGTDLDGKWNYIYFGYKRTSMKVGNANGFVQFHTGISQQTDFALNEIIHNALQSYLYFSVGSSGTKFKQVSAFNGQVARVRLSLGSGSFITDIEAFQKYVADRAPVPVTETKSGEFLLVEGTEVHHRETEGDPEPIVYNEEFAGADEYAISLWFRWNELRRVPWESLFTLTYNEPEHFQNAKRAGDRVLSLLQFADGRLFFSTYTNTVNDGFEYIYHESKVVELLQGSWIYAYFGYSRTNERSVSYIKTKVGEDYGVLPTIHRVPKYLAIYKAKDPFHTPFNGKIAYFEVLVGSTAFHEKEYDVVNSFVLGSAEFTPKTAIIWNYEEEVVAIAASEDSEPITHEWEDGDTPETNIDGLSEYAFGFWFRYLTAYPQHLYEKPQWLQLARLTSNKDVEDATKTGDRTLAVFIGKGFYHFTTYSMIGPKASIF
jgi:hypothetical protein